MQLKAAFFLPLYVHFLQFSTKSIKNTKNSNVFLSMLFVTLTPALFSLKMLIFKHGLQIVSLLKKKKKKKSCVIYWNSWVPLILPSTSETGINGAFVVDYFQQLNNTYLHWSTCSAVILNLLWLVTPLTSVEYLWAVGSLRRVDFVFVFISFI